MIRRRGYSLVEWTVIFAIVSAGVIFYLSPAKRAITSKTMGLADHLIWGTWGSEVQQDGGRNYNQIGAATTTSVSDQYVETNEAAGKIQSKVDSHGSSTSSYSSY